jgi:hypothetical protein
MAKTIVLLASLVTLGTLVVPKVTSKSGNLSVQSYELNLRAKCLKNKAFMKLVNKRAGGYERKLLVTRVVSAVAIRPLAPTQKREKHALLTLLLSFGASACSTSTVTRTRSVARDLSRLVERRLNLEARADHRNGQTRKFSYLVRVSNAFVFSDLRRAIA